MIEQNLVVKIPPMLAGTELLSALEVLPDYDESIRDLDAATRLMALSDLYKLYLPSQMSVEIYSKLYLALLRSLQKKQTSLAIQQQTQNYRAIRQQTYSGIIGGSDSFTIIGASGIGKSTAISRAISLITGNSVIEVEEPYTTIIPCLVVQCPFDSSVKGLLLEILRKVDENLGSKYYENAMRVRATTDMLIGSVSQVALNHIGLLIVDEIQNVVNSKHGKSLVGALTQLINNSGISVCMVGTPESALFFEQAMQLARRSLGIQYGSMGYDAYFEEFCDVLFSYQFVRNETILTPGIMEWLYEHSAGIISVVVSLVHDAQEIAILSGKESLNLETLNMAYQQRLSLLHGYIEPAITKKPQTTITKQNAPATRASANTAIENENIISQLVTMAKNQQLDLLPMLKDYMSIVEVSI
ncbi:MAG: hypothetical protein E7431_04035 [Ruminococcaceae bacterium]|nr:hypothetical protein [Oscillospiraceae bacterium]